MSKIKQLKDVNYDLERYCSSKIKNRITPYEEYAKRVSVVFFIFFLCLLVFAFIKFENNLVVLLSPFFTLIFYINNYVFKEIMFFDKIKFKDRNVCFYNCYNEIEIGYVLNFFKKIYLTMNWFLSSFLLTSLSSLLLLIFVDFVSIGTNTGFFEMIFFIMLMMTLFISYALFPMGLGDKEGSKKSKKEMEIMKKNIEFKIDKIKNYNSKNNINKLLSIKKELTDSNLKGSIIMTVIENELNKELSNKKMNSIEDYVLKESNHKIEMETE